MKKILLLLLFLVCLALPAQASITAVSTCGGTGNEVSGTTLVLTVSTQCDVGNEAILWSVFDNTGTTDADHSEVTSVVDSKSNTWTKLREFTNGQGSAAAGVTTSAWRSRLTATLTTSDTVTVTYANTITAKALRIFAFSSTNALQIAAGGATQNATDGANGVGSLTISSLPSKEYLFVRLAGKESSVNTEWTPTTNFTVMGFNRSGTGGGTSTLATTLRGEYHIVTATTETSNPTWTGATDAASVFLALEESSAVAPTRRRAIVIQ